MTPQQLATRLRDPVLSQCRIVQRNAADLLERGFSETNHPMRRMADVHEQLVEEKLVLAKHCEALSATIRRLDRENAELATAQNRLVQEIMELRAAVGDDWK